MAFTQNASDFRPFFHRNSEGENPGFAPKLRSTGSALRLGLALALFSSVGFESAKTLASGGPRAAEDHSSRGHSKRLVGWGYLHTVRLQRSAWLALHRRPVLADG